MVFMLAALMASSSSAGSPSPSSSSSARRDGGRNVDGDWKRKVDGGDDNGNNNNNSNNSTTHHPFLSAFPKCEHHIHLEGALTAPLLLALSAKNNIPLPSSSPDQPPTLDSLTALLSPPHSSLQAFLTLYEAHQTVLRTASDFDLLAWTYLRRAHADHVVHAELSLDAQAHTARGVALSAAIDGVSAARRRAEAELGVSSRLVLCFQRDRPVADALRTLREAAPHLASGAVAGVGLDSCEAGFPPGAFAGVFAEAARLGARTTAHAGEGAGWDYVRDAVERLGVARIDHGVRAAESAELVARLAAAGTLLTVCPLSNVSLGCVAAVRELPVRRFLDAGVRFSINSDDPAYFGGYLLDNYVAVQEAFGLSVGEWGVIGRASIEGSWVDGGRKREMLGELEALLKGFEGAEPRDL
ncbi:hypothetical protein FGG08_002430 [Glutinoglossum americanum]|uniref:Adenine deaminase n=1 Tax=Glutinoglossum americanum TaxID=1670608 RepID=A0A9P8I4R7_9PEZI|nr:hypothetical protein FGG08_002430 [Glutinoglossum americanum]